MFSKFTPYAWLYLLVFAVWPFVSLSTIPDPLLLPRLGLMALVVGILSIWLIISSRQLPKAIPFSNKATLALLAWALLSTASIAWAGNKAEALQSALAIWPPIALGLLTVRLAINQKINIHSLTTGALLFSAGILLFAFIDIGEAVAATGPFKLVSITSHMGNKNELTTVLALLLPLLLLGASKAKGWQRYLPIVVSIASLAIIFLLKTRAVWLGLGAASLAILAIYTYKRGMPNVKRIAAVGVIVVALFSIVFGLSSYHNRGSGILGTETLQTRFALWGSTAQLIKDAPLAGVGAGNWKIESPKYLLPSLDATKPYFRTLVLGQSNFQRPHNDFLWVASEVGIPAALCFTAFFVLLLAYILHGIKTATDDTVYMHLALLAFMIIYLVVSCFAFPLERPTHQMLLMVVAGFIVATHSASNNHSNTSIAQTLVPVSSLLLMGVCMWGLFSWYTAEVEMKKGLQARMQGDLNGAMKHYNAALGPWYNMDGTAMPVAWYQGEYFAMIGQFEQALQQYKMAEQIHPYKMHNLANVGVAYFQLQQPDSAIVYFNKAITLSPAFTEANTNMCIYYMQLNQPDEAMKYLLQSYPDVKDERFLQINQQLMSYYIGTLIVTEPSVTQRAKLNQLIQDKNKLLHLHEIQFKEKGKLLREIIYSYL